RTAIAFTSGTCSRTTRSRRASLAACDVALAAVALAGVAWRAVVLATGLAGTPLRLLGTARTGIFTSRRITVVPLTGLAVRAFAGIVITFVISWWTPTALGRLAGFLERFP